MNKKEKIEQTISNLKFAHQHSDEDKDFIKLIEEKEKELKELNESVDE